MAEKPSIKIVLTPEQQQQIKQQTGKEINRLKLEPIEERLAPAIASN
jgi:hypothetical protein